MPHLSPILWLIVPLMFWIILFIMMSYLSWKNLPLWG